MSKLLTLFLLSAFLLSGAHPPRPGKDLAIFFAIEQYKNWPKLNYPIDEAEAIAADLYDIYGFDTLIIRNPSKRQVLAKLESLLGGSYAADGQLLLFFSGHGDYRENTKLGFFIPADGVANDLYQESYLAYTDLKRRVNGIPCPHILLAIDACYSGTFDDEVVFRDPPSEWKRMGDEGQSQRDNFIKEQLKDKSRLFASSGGKVRTPDRSQFARQFREALASGGGADGILTFNMLAGYLDKAEPKPHTAGFLDHKGGNFLFIGKTGPAQNPPDPESATFQAARQQNTIEAYEYYLKVYPGGRFRTTAQNALALLYDDRAWTIAAQENTRAAYDIYLAAYPAGAHRAEAEAAKKKLAGVTTPTAPIYEQPKNTYMIPIEGGTFQMGDLFGEGDSDETKHTVTVNSFLLAKYELTFKEYDAFCEATKREKPSDAGWGRDTRPAIYISWLDAVEYCNWRSRQEGLTPAYTIDGEKVTCSWSANGYRLPTEAEWEYAARQKGQKVRFGNGKDIADPKEINFNASADYKKSYSVVGEYRQKTVPVGSLNSPNSLGLHDMSGNVREWCWDWKGTYPSGPVSHPKGPDSGSYRVVRGGSWYFYPAYVRAADRYSYSPGSRYDFIGFRLARTF